MRSLDLRESEELSLPCGAEFECAGYFPKAEFPFDHNWINNPTVRESRNFGQIGTPFRAGSWIDSWRHNDFGMFNTKKQAEEMTPVILPYKGLRSVVQYYDVIDHFFNIQERRWLRRPSDASLETNVDAPSNWKFIGYDVTDFMPGTNQSVSPLWCNRLANFFKVNSHCLLDDLGACRDLLFGDEIRRLNMVNCRILGVWIQDIDGGPLPRL